MAGEGTIGTVAGAETAGIGGLGSQTAGAIAASIGLVNDLGGALRQMTQSIFASAAATTYLGGKLDDYLIKKQIKARDLSKEAAAAFRVEASALREAGNTYMFVAGAAIGAANKITMAFEAQEKINTSMYKYSTLRTMPGGVVAGSKEFMARQYDLAVDYGDKFVEANKRTYDELLDYTKKMPKGERESFLETVTGLTLTTGADYGRSIKVLVDNYRSYGIEGKAALGITEALRVSWDKANLPVGSFAEGLENILNLTKDFTRMGARAPQAIAEAFSAVAGMTKAGMGMGQVGQVQQGLAQFRGTTIGAQIPLYAMARKAGTTNLGYREFRKQMILDKSGMGPAKAVQEILRSVVPKGMGAREWLAQGGETQELIQQYVSPEIMQTLLDAGDLETGEGALDLAPYIDTIANQPIASWPPELRKLLHDDPDYMERIKNYITLQTKGKMTTGSEAAGNAWKVGAGMLGVGGAALGAYGVYKGYKKFKGLGDKYSAGNVSPKSGVSKIGRGGSKRFSGGKPTPKGGGKGKLGLALKILGLLGLAGGVASAQDGGEDSGITAGDVFDFTKDAFESVGPGSVEQMNLEDQTPSDWLEKLGVKPIELGSKKAGPTGGGTVGTVIIDVRLNGQAVEQVMADTATQQYVRVNIGNALGVK